MPAEPGPKAPLRLPRAACLPLLAVLILAGIPLGIVAFGDVEPRQRPIFPFDATVMHPINKTTVETIDFLIPGFVFAFILLAVTEFYIMHPQLPRQLQIDNYTQSLVYLLAGFLAHISIQQLSSVLAGKPRPNFLATCKPSITAAAALAGPDTTITAADCTADRNMNNSLRSFPSGHASGAMFLGMYPVMYLLYSLLVRREVGHGTSKASRLLWDARMALLTSLNGLVFAMAWYTGLSRYIDNKHSIEDIVAGWLLGLVFAVWATVECFVAQRALAARFADETRTALTNHSHELQALSDPAVSLSLPPHNTPQWSPAPHGGHNA